MTEEDMCDLHRVNGKAVLVGPDCNVCERRSTVTYACMVGNNTPVGRCGYQLEVDGRFTWSWQGRSHWHKADDPTDMMARMQLHGDEAHEGDHAWVPMMK